MLKKFLHITVMVALSFSGLIAMDESAMILRSGRRIPKTTSANSCLQLQTYPSQVADDEMQVRIDSDGNKTMCIEEERRPVEIGLTIPLVARGHEDIYRRFFNGALIYRPNPESDDGMIHLPIRGLSNPLEGTFDLSRCGDAGKYLSISTGYRQRKKEENASKVEIWVAPRFLIESELDTTTSHFKPIMNCWKSFDAHVGIFWMRGNWEDLGWYDYLITQSMDELGDQNLHEKCKRALAKPPLRTRVFEYKSTAAYIICFTFRL